MKYPPIGDYAAIGDCRCLALISRQGSLDWLCLPRFDSPAVFGALLDAEKGGRFVVRPVGPYRVRRRYLDNTNALETVFSTDGGEVRLTDFMPVGDYHDYRRSLWPERRLVRLVECLAGEVELEAHYEPRPEYGHYAARLRNRSRLGLQYEHRGQALNLQSDFPLALREDRAAARGRETLRRSESRGFSLSFTERSIGTIPPVTAGYLAEQLAMTCQWWRQWADRCTYRGRYRREVLRSLLVLKLLSYAPSGAVVAAPTSSLPEVIGGSRNWDYRYCWLRDAAMTIRAFLHLGYGPEAEAFLSWLLHTTSLSRPELQVLYSLYGETRLQERELGFLDGYRASRPVRAGNAATGQLQLDIYGEVVQGAFEIGRQQKSFDRATGRMLKRLGRTVCRLWRRPDAGIWEIRASPRHNTHSKVMCWVALDRLVELQRLGLVDIDAESFAAERDAIRAEIEGKGYDAELRSYISYFGAKTVDVSLFMLPIYGYVDASDPRMVATYERIQATLGRDGLLYRFPFGYDGIREAEGAFAIAVFLAVTVLASRGETDQARALFDKALGYASDLGLYGEEIDPASGAALGNFPQAYTHVGLINAAMALAAVEGR